MAVGENVLDSVLSWKMKRIAGNKNNSGSLIGLLAFDVLTFALR